MRRMRAPCSAGHFSFLLKPVSCDISVSRLGWWAPPRPSRCSLHTNVVWTTQPAQPVFSNYHLSTHQLTAITNKQKEMLSRHHHSASLSIPRSRAAARLGEHTGTAPALAAPRGQWRLCLLAKCAREAVAARIRRVGKPVSQPCHSSWAHMSPGMLWHSWHSTRGWGLAESVKTISLQKEKTSVRDPA